MIKEKVFIKASEYVLSRKAFQGEVLMKDGILYVFYDNNWIDIGGQEKELETKPMICKCCGAPYHGTQCDYCGTEYWK